MSHHEFNAALETFDLKQSEFVRLVAYLSGVTPDISTINRYARGRARLPWAVTAFVRAWALLDEPKRVRVQFIAARETEGPEDFEGRMAARLHDITREQARMGGKSN